VTNPGGGVLQGQQKKNRPEGLFLFCILQAIM
jgi:hypothetical protein